jgi:hypothetical protein
MDMNTPAGRDTLRDGTPIGEIIARRERQRALATVSDADLIEAREQMDGGLRLAFPSLFDAAPEPDAVRFDGLGADPVPVPEIDDAAIGRAADKVAAFRTDAARDLHHLDKHAPRRVYLEAQGLVAQCDEFLGAVRVYFSEVGS